MEDRTPVRMPHQHREGQAEAARGLVLVQVYFTFQLFRRGEVCDFMGFGVKQWVAAEGVL